MKNDPQTLTPSIVRQGGVQVEAVILESLRCDVTTIAYKTTDEAWCSAYSVEIQKTDSMRYLEALVLLASRQLHWLEEWRVQETTVNDARLIAEKWLVPTFGRYDLRAKPGNEVAECVAGTLQPIVDWLSNNSSMGACGIFKNDVRQSLSQPLPILSASILGGMILEAEWNSVDVFYETATTFGLLFWGTGA